MRKSLVQRGLPLVLIIFISFSLLGCATGYQSKGYSGGYSETQLDVNLFRVSFNGNALTDRERVKDFTLLRSAELTLEHGYKYFVVIDENQSESLSAYTTPVQSNTSMNVYSTGNSAYGTATTTTTGGQTYFASKPSASNTIVCFAVKPEGVFSYSAEFLTKSLKAKYQIDPEQD